MDGRPLLVQDIFKAKDDEIDDLKRKVIDLRDQLQMYPLDGHKTDVAVLNKVSLLRQHDALLNPHVVCRHYLKKISKYRC